MSKKTFGEIWSSLTKQQADYLRQYINKQRIDAVNEYKRQNLNKE
jgi:hypothetical protein